MATAGTNAGRDAGTPPTAGERVRVGRGDDRTDSASRFTGTTDPPVVTDADDVARRWMELGEGWQAVLLGLLFVLAVRLGLTIPW